MKRHEIEAARERNRKILDMYEEGYTPKHLAIRFNTTVAIIWSRIQDARQRRAKTEDPLPAGS